MKKKKIISNNHCGQLTKAHFQTVRRTAKKVATPKGLFSVQFGRNRLSQYLRLEVMNAVVI